MKRDEHGCLRAYTEDELGAIANEADARNDAEGCEIEDPLSFMDKHLQQSLRISYDGQQELAEFYRKKLCTFISPAQMVLVEKYVAARARALATRDTIERLRLRG